MASESVPPPEKQLRRSKRDRQPRLELSVNEEKIGRQPTLAKSQQKNIVLDEFQDDQSDLYQPGDIVWCKLGSFPWWPALVYRCDAEGGIHTKLLNSNNKPKRQFFVYFYGKYLEYSWISTRWLLKYAGLSNFISYAESAVQNASKKSEKQELANRYQLKVSMKKRVQWDEAIELADRALSLTNNERIKEFSDLLDEVKDTKDQTRMNESRRKNSTKDSVDGEQTSNTSAVKKTEAILPIVIRRKPKVFDENQLESKEKNSKRKPEQLETEKANDSITSTSNANSTKKRRVTRSSESAPSTRSNNRTAAANDGNEVEYEYPSSTVVDSTTASVIRIVSPNTPPLSNFEQKQLVEALLKHPKGVNLTLDEAHNFVNDKATEIVFENHHYRITNISPEWFYDAILLRYPSVAFQYQSWFDNVQTDVIPNASDLVQLKQWQVTLMIRAKAKADQSKSDKDIVI